MKINANDQLDLKGACLTGCNDLSYSYNIYMLVGNQWIPFTNVSYYHKPEGFIKDLTAKKSLFSDFPNQAIWKFELEAFNPLKNISGSASLIVYVNQPPTPGICDISPKSGTTSTIFNIYCADWSDNDGGIVNFTFYGNFFIFIYSKLFFFINKFSI
jgi:hypothetical protein